MVKLNKEQMRKIRLQDIKEAIDDIYCMIQTSILDIEKEKKIKYVLERELDYV